MKSKPQVVKSYDKLERLSSALSAEASVFRCSAMPRGFKAKKSSGGIFSSLTGLFSMKSKAMPESRIVETSVKKKSLRKAEVKDYESKEVYRGGYEMEMCCDALEDLKELSMPIGHLEEMKESEITPKTENFKCIVSKSKIISADINLLIHSQNVDGQWNDEAIILQYL